MDRKPAHMLIARIAQDSSATAASTWLSRERMAMQLDTHTALTMDGGGGGHDLLYRQTCHFNADKDSLVSILICCDLVSMAVISYCLHPLLPGIVVTMSHIQIHKAALVVRPTLGT